jgi:hypothetical protein
MTTRAEAAGVVAGFGILAIAAAYPLAGAIASRLPSDLGDPLLTAWTLAWDADRIRHGFRGLWDAPNFFPYHHTLLYSDHLLGIALLTAPIQWLTGNPVLVYNLAFLGSVVLAGAGMYVLARELTGRCDAAVVAGLAFACQPFRVSHIAHLQWLITGWLPLSLWGVHRYFSTRALRYLLLAALFFLLQALTAAYFTYFALLPLVLAGVVEAWRTRPPPGRLALDLAAAGLLVAIVTAPVALAYYEVRAQYGIRRTGEEISGQSADVGDYLSGPPRLRLWGVIGSGRGEHELFPGAATLILAAIGAASVSFSAAGGLGAAAASARRQGKLYAAIAATAFVLSLGPEPTAWGHHLGIPGPYRFFLWLVPGLDGLRAVARLAVVVQVALAVLAGFGAAWILDRFRPPSRRVALGVLALVIVAEGWAAPIPTAAFSPGGERPDRAAYAYLRTLPAGAAIELPTSLVQFEQEFLYQYMTLAHGHRVVNGHSGYLTPLITFLGGGHSPLNEVEHVDEALAMLRGIGVRYAVIHRALFEDGSVADAWLAAVNRRTPQVLEARLFGDTTVASLAPADPPPSAPAVRLVPPGAIRARASQSPERLPFLFDGDPDSRWLSGDHQRGDEWIELAFDRPRNVRVVRMTLASRSFGDYPRDLAIDATEGPGTRRLFRGPVLAQFARGLIADGTYPRIEIALPENRAQSLQLQQLGTTHSFYWSIHELELGEAGP